MKLNSNVLNSPFSLIDLQPQDRIVTIESNKSFCRMERGYLDINERFEQVYYVNFVDWEKGSVYALTSSCLSYKFPFDHIIDIQKSDNPILARFPTETARIIGYPGYGGKFFRVVAVDIYEGRITGVCIHKPECSPDGPNNWFHLRTERIFSDGSIPSDKDLITNLPSNGFNVRRTGNPATSRQRIERTAKQRIS